MPGSRGIEGVQPWGWWLRVRAGVIEDADGRQWRDVRQAFWEGHLGFPSTGHARERSELLLRVLASIERHWIGPEETERDLFCGDMLFWHFYQGWLASIGLVEDRRGANSFTPPLTDEGRSVLLMLQSTRVPEWINLPFGAVLEAVRRADRTEADDERERALRIFERAVTDLPYLFARETINGRHLVTLTGLDTGSRMPLRKVVWSLSFPADRVRDDFFGWLADRVNRWADWGELAYSKGADALTQHLLGLFAARLSAS